MNWRGILGIYAGLAVVLGGAWLWMRFSSVWALGVAAAGVLLAITSVIRIILARRSPRPPKGAKPAKAAKAGVAVVADDEMDAIARARLAAIRERTSRQEVEVERAESPSAVEAGWSTGPDKVAATEFSGIDGEARRS